MKVVTWAGPGRFGPRSPATYLCQADLEHVTQSRPDSGLGSGHFQYKILEHHPRCWLAVRLRLSQFRTGNDPKGVPRA